MWFQSMADWLGAAGAWQGWGAGEPMADGKPRAEGGALGPHLQ